MAGGVVGGVAGVLTLVAAILFYLRRRRITASVNAGKGSWVNTVPEPFPSTTAYVTPSFKTRHTNGENQSGSASLPTHRPAITVDTSHGRESNIETANIAELPRLVQRLISVLQGRPGELPPRYEE